MILFTIYKLINLSLRFFEVKIVLWFPIWISHVVRVITFQINEQRVIEKEGSFILTEVSNAVSTKCRLHADHRPGSKCKMQTADRVQNANCRLQTGYKMQTADWVQNADCRLGAKCRLQTRYKMQTADWVQNADCRPGTKCRLQTGYKMQTADWVQNADCRPGTKCRLQTGYKMSDSRKYPYLYHGRLLGYPKGRGVL